MSGRWLLFFDLDGTLWDHKDISSLDPPFRRLSPLRIADSRGVVVTVYEDSLKLLKWARSRGAIVSALSWNDHMIAVSALESLGVLGLFDYLAIEPHPGKGDMARRVIESLRKERGLELSPCRIIYIDDRDIHVNDVREKIGDIAFLMAWRDFKSFEEATERIESILSSCS